METPIFAFVGQGRLMLCRPSKEPEAIRSDFVSRIEERSQRDRERHGWRGGGMWNIGSPAMGLSLGGGLPLHDVLAARFVSVAAGRDGTMLYSIATSHVGGLFEYNMQAAEERRLVHKAGFNAESLTAHPESGELAFCIRYDDGSAAIGIAQSDGGRHRTVTEGDSIDEAPSWVRGEGRRIVYQSAGIARDSNGVPADHTNARIEILDLDRQVLEVVVEDVRFDYLAPRLMADGTLYAIRRPYQSVQPRISPLGLLKDIVLFPIRVVLAVVAFLNFFSMFFRRQPLYGAGGPPAAMGDAAKIRLWGRWVDTRKALAKSSSEQALVGRDWQLIRRDRNGEEAVLADRVVDFDLCDDGRLLYTNGSRVHLLEANGAARELAIGKLIERVAVLRSALQAEPTN